MLGDADIDAVEILTPTHLHHEHVLAALRAGKHVSVQKPVTNSVDEARDLGRVGVRCGPDTADQRVLRPLPAARAREEARPRWRDRAPDRDPDQDRRRADGL